MSGHSALNRAFRWWGLVAAVALVLPLWLGCSSGTQSGAPSSTPPSSPAPGPRPKSTATLAIVYPTPGSEVTGDTVTVRLRLEGAQVVPQTSLNLTPDKGHIHVSVDGKVVSMLYGVEQDVPITPGPHLMQAEFVAMDHFPFNPRVIAVVTFTSK